MFINWKEGKHMDNKINKLPGCLTGLCNSDIDRIIDYVIQILNVNNQQADRPDCPHCGSKRIIKHGHKDDKQRFLCHDCNLTWVYPDQHSF